MLKLPSERLYFNKQQHEFVFAGLDVLVFRIDGTKGGSFAHERRPIEYDGAADAYTDREFDEAFYEALVRLRKKFESAERGRYRLNLPEIALVAYAFRFAHAQLLADPRWKSTTPPRRIFADFERDLENARRRLVRATIRKFNRAVYDRWRTRWQKFNSWCHFHISGSLFGQRRLRPAKPTFRATHRAELDQFVEWINELITERCEATVSEDVLLRIAKQTKRRARRRRFAGLTSAELLSNKPRYADKIFAYIQRHLALPLKFQYLDLSTRQSRTAARLRRAMAVNDSAPLSKSAPLVPSGSREPMAVVEHSTTPVAVLLEIPTSLNNTWEDCVEMVGGFLLDIEEGYRWQIVKDAVWSVQWAEPFPQTAKTSLPPPKDLIASGGAPFPLPSPANAPQFWESGWIVNALGLYVGAKDMAPIIQDAWESVKLITSPQAA